MGFDTSTRLQLVSLTATALLLCSAAVRPQSRQVVLDKVIAVVNNRAILASDLDEEMRLSVLEPLKSTQVIDRRGALDELISRALIQQQIRREEEAAAEPSDEEIRARILELRRDLPACRRYDCVSDSGWSRFLADNHLSEDQVDSYMRLRLQILSLIENRFRQGIRIPPEDIEQYYNKTLLPQYPAGQPVPSLEVVSHRIEEILLQQQVTNMFDAWLDSLRKQGDVQILDPALNPTPDPSPDEPNAQPRPNPSGDGA